MSCPDCQEAREFALEQMRLASHVTRQENRPAPVQPPKEALPQSGSYHKG